MNVIVKDDRIWNLLMKCQAGECNEVEEIELNSWRNMNQENSDFCFEVNNMLKDVNSAMNISDINSEVAWKRVRTRIHQKDTSSLPGITAEGKVAKDMKRLSVMWRVAPSVVLIVGVGLGYLLWENRAPQINTLVAKNLEVSSVTLSDGTKVAVNGGSTLKYPALFKGKERGVSLTGEAFFNVTSDKQHPFVIDADGMEVRVLGTSFNIKAIDGSREATVVVESGVVQVTAGENTVLIRRGETALFNKENNTLLIYNSRNANFKAWKTKKIKFVNTPLTEAFTTIENVYKVNVEIINDSLVHNKNIDANFDKQTIDFVLKTICDTYHMQYVHQGNRYIVSGK